MRRLNRRERERERLSNVFHARIAIKTRESEFELRLAYFQAT